MSWLQHRDTTALAYWGASFLLSALSAALIAARGEIANTWSIVVANAILVLGHGVLWSGTRNFEGRPISVLGTLAGPVIWLAACTLSFIYDSPAARATVITPILGVYLLLAAFELWRGRGDALTSRWPIIGLLVAHAVLMPLRIPLAGSLSGLKPTHIDLLAFVAFEAVFISICTAYLLGSVVSERTVRHFKQASLSDPLTGAANRRAFLDQAPRVMRRAKHARQPVVLLLFDLDRFKEINDMFGHQAGDQVLVTFCEIATSLLRPGDLFARIGGEEFACLLADTSQHAALSLAERVRAACESTSHNFDSAYTATVSIGVAMMGSKASSTESLLAAADRALYRAKARGRNRVETAEPVATLVHRADVA